MRDPQSGLPRRRQTDAEIRTMVEVVEVPSSHISEASPRGSARRQRSRRRAAPAAPARTPHDPRGPHTSHAPSHTQRGAHAQNSPQVSPRAPPPRPRPAQQPASPGQSPRLPKLQHVASAYNKGPLSSIRSVSETQETVMGDPLTPISRIQCAKKQPESEFSMEGFEAREELETTTSKFEYESFTTGNEFRDATTTQSSRDGRSHGKENVAQPFNGTTSARSVDRKTNKEKKTGDGNPAGCEVTRLLKQLCGGDTGGSRSERTSGAKNAQLVCISSSPRQPSTPQLLRILEETIQKKVPKSIYHKPKPKTADRLRLTFNIPQQTADNLFQYRTKFVQHMLASSLYANSAVGKPWEMIGSVSQHIIDEILLKCAKEMQIQNIVLEMYKRETQ
ncbi:uncharacterized protein LOC126371980 [Pectinophora gossypiella]|uniref:uncharacterized protein LOC126371980 n=1 Tax=Pectinophora gossypiella TaxID=13191 RepID=UPI00214E2548|nr:uncharacterized protein LOC126371980 [Pectinophora gossypiella]